MKKLITIGSPLTRAGSAPPSKTRTSTSSFPTHSRRRSLHWWRFLKQVLPLKPTTRLTNGILSSPTPLLPSPQYQTALLRHPRPSHASGITLSTPNPAPRKRQRPSGSTGLCQTATRLIVHFDELCSGVLQTVCTRRLRILKAHPLPFFGMLYPPVNP